MEDFKNIMKVVGYLIWGMACFYIIFGIAYKPEVKSVGRLCAVAI